MKTGIHPKWYPEARVKCACGNAFTIGATLPEINVEVCSNCHPYYTGQMKFLDKAGRVDAFLAKQKQASSENISKSEKRRLKRQRKIEEELNKPESLDELRKPVKASEEKPN